MAYRDHDELELSRRHCAELEVRCEKLELELAFKDTTMPNPCTYKNGCEISLHEYRFGIGMGCSLTVFFLFVGELFGALTSTWWLVYVLLGVIFLGGLVLTMVSCRTLTSIATKKMGPPAFQQHWKTLR